MKLVGIVAASALALGTIFSTIATANVGATCVTPGTVRASIYNFNPSQTHPVNVEVVVDGEPLGLNRVVNVTGNLDVDLTVPEGFVQVVINTFGRGAATYTSPVVKCVTEPVNTNPDVTPEGPQVEPDKPVVPVKKPKPPRKPVVKISTKRVQVVVNRVPCFTPKSGARAYVDLKTVVTWYKNGVKFRTKTSPVHRVYGARCAVNG